MNSSPAVRRKHKMFQMWILILSINLASPSSVFRCGEGAGSEVASIPHELPSGADGKCVVRFELRQPEISITYLYDYDYLDDDEAKDECQIEPTQAECVCFETDCNLDLKRFHEEVSRQVGGRDVRFYRMLVALTSGPPATTKGHTVTDGEQEASPETKNIAVRSTTTSISTSTTRPSTSNTTESTPYTTTSTIAMTPTTSSVQLTDASPTSGTSTFAPPSSTPISQTENAKSSLYLGLFIGSAACNVLTVVIILILIVALVKMKKKGGEAKRGTTKKEQKGQKTPTAIRIENPIVSKEPSIVPPPASTTKAANQPEEVADKTTNTGTLDLDTTGGTTDSDSTGTEGPSEVRVTVRGFNRD